MQFSVLTGLLLCLTEGLKVPFNIPDELRLAAPGSLVPSFSQVAKSLGTVTGAAIGGAKRVQIGRSIRIHRCQGLLELFDCRLILLLADQESSEIEMRLPEVGLRFNCFLVLIAGFRKPTLTFQQISKIVVCVGVG